MGNESRGYGFGTFKGVFTPSILTIIGVVMYLRFGWVLGSVGLAKTLTIVTLSSAITFLTGLSISALATNMQVKGGGAYFMVSRSFGVEIGAAIGIPLFLSQAVGVAFYVVGFTESFLLAFPQIGGLDPRLIGLGVLLFLSAVAAFSADIALKSQYVIMAFIILSLVSFFAGGTPAGASVSSIGTGDSSSDFWHVLAVFFPAVTGILSGVGMSGDLKNPSRSLPLGTIAAVLVGWVVYMAVPVGLHCFVSDRSALMNDPMIMQRCARIPWLIVAGVWAASLSSALGSLLAAPRTLQALAQDRAVPSIIGRGYGPTNDPRLASLLGMSLAAVGIWFGNINVIAPVLTIFNLTAYALLNLSSGFEALLANPSWRPTFRVSPGLSFLGFAGCTGMMMMISPGATFVAAVCIGGIWWVMSRRVMKSRWGDMRTGLLMYVVHLALRVLNRRHAEAHAWRPNLLVLSGAPERRPRIVDLARALTGSMGYSTFAVVVPSVSCTLARSAEISSALRSWLDRRRIDAQIRIHPSAGTKEGMCELIKTYGYGPLEPNTVLLGDLGEVDLAGVMILLAERRRNAIVVPQVEGALLAGNAGGGFIDIWWRGKGVNATFMLALAWLVARANRFTGSVPKLRICHIVELDEKLDDVRNRIAALVDRARITAEIVVLPQSEKGAVARMAEVSSGSSLVLMGLRHPCEGESAEVYSGYLTALRAVKDAIPQTVFACASEDVDFDGIFR